MARNLRAESPTRPGSSAVICANEALDLFSVGGVASCSLGDIDSFFASWEQSDGRTTLRIFSSGQIIAQLQVGEPILISSEGQQISVRPLTKWHRSFRYFRLSQVTTDLFDAFRNLYLALESLLEVIAPRTQARETTWLRDALRAAGTYVDLASFTDESSQDPASALYEQVWSQVRNNVFHAKAGWESFLPLDEGPREKVLKTLLRLDGLYTALAEKVLCVHYQTTEVGESFFDTIRTTLYEHKVTVGSDDSFLVAKDGASSLRRLPVIELATYSGEQDERTPSQVCLYGHVLGEEVMKGIGAIRRISIERDGQAGLVEELDAPLTLEGVDDLQVLIAIAMLGSRWKQRYPS